MMIYGLTETAYYEPKKSTVLQKVRLAFSVCFFYQSPVHSAPNPTTCSHFLFSQVSSVLCPKQLCVQSFPVTMRNKTPTPKKTNLHATDPFLYLLCLSLVQAPQITIWAYLFFRVLPHIPCSCSIRCYFKYLPKKGITALVTTTGKQLEACVDSLMFLLNMRKSRK